MGSFGNAGVYLLQFVFGALQMLFLLRVLLQLVRANFYNPLCQFIINATNPVLMPLGKLLPRVGRFDSAAALVFFILVAIETWLLFTLFAGASPSPLGLLVFAFADGLDLLLLTMLVIMVVRIIFSWVQPAQGNAIVPLLYQLSDPVMRPAQRLIPPLGGIDFSPILVFLAINLIRMTVVDELKKIAVSL